MVLAQNQTKTVCVWFHAGTKGGAFMPPPTVLTIPQVVLQSSPGDNGSAVLTAIFGMAHAALDAAVAAMKTRNCPRFAALGRLRGTGRGIHFSNLVDQLEMAYPRSLESPFEGSELVAGAVWDGNSLVSKGCKAALAKLRWLAGADDLPMHVHDHSDRFIIVNQGRGFFHVSDQPIEEFDGSDVRSIPARERDVFLFTRGVVHTFSTLDQPMTLLSCQLPYMPFHDPDQYRLPKKRWIARENPEPRRPGVGCDPAWTVLAMGGGGTRQVRSVWETVAPM